MESQPLDVRKSSWSQQKKNEFGHDGPGCKLCPQKLELLIVIEYII